MLWFMLLSALWAALGVVGRRLLLRKGYDFGGIDDVRHAQRPTVGAIARQGDTPSGAVVVGGPMTFLAGLVLPKRQKHYSGPED